MNKILECKWDKIESRYKTRWNRLNLDSNHVKLRLINNLLLNVYIINDYILFFTNNPIYIFGGEI